MNINGTQVTLIPMQEKDTELILKWRNSKEVKQFFIFQEDFTKEMHLDWIHNVVNTGKTAQFIIYENSSNTPVGSVYLRDIDKVHKKAEYGIYIGESSAIGKGLGTECAKLIIDYGFNCLKLHKIYLRALDNNVNAIKSYEKAGFIKEGLLRDDVLLNGKYTNIVWMSVINNGDY